MIESELKGSIHYTYFFHLFDKRTSLGLVYGHPIKSIFLMHLFVNTFFVQREIFYAEIMGLGKNMVSRETIVFGANMVIRENRRESIELQPIELHSLELHSGVKLV